jgi:hypothetical protein
MQKIEGTKKTYSICKYAIKGFSDQIEKREKIILFQEKYDFDFACKF